MWGSSSPFCEKSYLDPKSMRHVVGPFLRVVGQFADALDLRATTNMTDTQDGHRVPSG